MRKFTLELNAAKNTDYMEKCFKQKLYRIKFATENSVDAYQILFKRNNLKYIINSQMLLVILAAFFKFIKEISTEINGKLLKNQRLIVFFISFVISHMFTLSTHQRSLQSV